MVVEFTDQEVFCFFPWSILFDNFILLRKTELSYKVMQKLEIVGAKFCNND